MCVIDILHIMLEEASSSFGGSNNMHTCVSAYDICVRRCGICQWAKFFLWPFGISIIQRLVQFRCKHGISISSTSRRAANSIGITCWPIHCPAFGQQSGNHKSILFHFILLLRLAARWEWFVRISDTQMNYIIFWSRQISVVSGGNPQNGIRVFGASLLMNSKSRWWWFVCFLFWLWQIQRDKIPKWNGAENRVSKLDAGSMTANVCMYAWQCEK